MHFDLPSDFSWLCLNVRGITSTLPFGKKDVFTMRVLSKRSTWSMIELGHVHPCFMIFQDYKATDSIPITSYA